MDSMKCKRAQVGLSALPGIAIALGVGVLVTAVMGLVLAAFQTGQTTDGVSYNITGQGLAGLTNFSGQFGNIGLIAGVAILIGIVIIAFGAFMAKGSGGSQM